MDKKKRIILTIIFLMIIYSSMSFAEKTGEEITSITDIFLQEQLNSLNITELELILEDILRGNEGFFPEINIKESIKSIVKGENKLEINQIKDGVINVFFNEILNNLSLISQILIITVSCSVLTNLQSTFEKDTVAQLAHYACYIIMAMLMINSFMLALDLGKKTVVQMVNFMQVILPILLTLLIAIGGPSTKLIFHPMIIGVINIIGSLIKNLVFPLIFFTFIIGVISNISNKIQFSKLSELMRQTIIVLISASFTVFIGIITMYGIGANIDGVTIRTAKFAVDNFVPIIGKFLSDAVEAVVGCSAILKNGIGMIGLVALFFICIVPAIKIIIIIFTYKAISALVEPISSINISSCFNEVSKSLLLILVGMLSVATMFFITITVIVEAGNATIMLR